MALKMYLKAEDSPVPVELFNDLFFISTRLPIELILKLGV